MSNLERSAAAMRRGPGVREHVSRAHRVKVSMPVVLELSSDCRVKAMIHDLSKDGFGLKSESLLHARQAIKILMTRETVRGELRWVDGYEAGGVFSEIMEAPRW